MIDAIPATLILLSFIVAFGILVPVLNIKFPKFISYRWCVVVVALALLIGAVVDFRALSDEARRVILVGGLVIVGSYVVLRTIEKALANGWLRGARIEASKGDLSVSLTSEDDKQQTEQQTERGHEDMH